MARQFWDVLMVPELCHASVIGCDRKVKSLPPVGLQDDPTLLISTSWLSSSSASATETQERLRESAKVVIVEGAEGVEVEGVGVEGAKVEGAGVEGTEVEGTEAVAEDNAVNAVVCAACARCACVRASRWEGSSSSASLAGSRTLLEAIRVRLVFSALFEPDGWAMVNWIEK